MKKVYYVIQGHNKVIVIILASCTNLQCSLVKAKCTWVGLKANYDLAGGEVSPFPHMYNSIPSEVDENIWRFGKTCP